MLPNSPIQDRGLGVLVWTEKALHTMGYPEHKGTNMARVVRQEYGAGRDEELVLTFWLHKHPQLQGPQCFLLL